MTKFLPLVFLAVFASAANAAIKPYFQDIKLPTQAVIEHQFIAAPLLGNVNRLLNTTSGPASATTKTITSFSAQPDVPRNITVTPDGSSSTIAGNVLITGTNYLGAVITENISLTGSGITTLQGNMAFKTVTSVRLPATQSPFTSKISVGTGAKLGLKGCLAHRGDIAWADLAGVREATLPTMASANNSVGNNTASLSSTLDGASDVDLYFVQNFRCL